MRRARAGAAGGGLTLSCALSNALTRVVTGMPHPSECELYIVNRDALFSFHKSTEAFLQKLMALFVSSHYRNTCAAFACLTHRSAL